MGEGNYEDVAIQPTFLQVCVLGAGDSFVSNVKHKEIFYNISARNNLLLYVAREIDSTA